ncbi:hypothetical protein ES703_30366 [subsurface metagenome]
MVVGSSVGVGSSTASSAGGQPMSVSDNDVIIERVKIVKIVFLRKFI